MKKKLLLSAFLLCTFVPSLFAEGIVLTAGNMEISAGGEATLTITASDYLSQYALFQLDISVPKGLTLAQRFNEDDEEWEDDVTSGIKKTKHSVANNCTDGIYTFVCTSGAEFVTFKTTSKEVLTVKFKAAEDVVNGTYPITLSNIIFSDEEANRVVMGSIPGTCTITGGPDPVTIPFTMTSAGWGTLILPFDADVPEGLTAYACTSSTQEGDDYRLNLEATEEMTANTPYIMAGEAKEYAFIGTPNFEQCSYTNGFLTGVYVPTAIDHGYAMQKHDDRVAFYKVNNGKSLTIPAYRCYMNDNPSGSLFYRLDGTTNVEGCLTDEPSDATLYDLQGRKLNTKPEQGLYLRDGKIYMVK